MKITQPRVIADRAHASAVARDTSLSTDSAIARVIAGFTPTAELAGAPMLPNWDRMCKPRSFAELQPTHFVPPTYDLLAYLAQRSLQAYESRACLERHIAEDRSIADLELFSRWTDAGFAYRREHTAVIAFRGTIVWNLFQWAHSNLLAVPIGRPLRHLGFQWAWWRLRPQILAWLTRCLPAGGDLMITGHSLGGAIAILAAYELADRYPIRAVVTIGAPRVGLTAFRDRYLHKACYPAIEGRSTLTLSQVTRRITYFDDLVARVPPPPIFRHVGDGVVVDDSGQLKAGESQSAAGRVIGGFDTAVGWVYEQLDEQRATSGVPVGGTVVLPEDVTRSTPILRIFDKTPTTPELASSRLGKALWSLHSRVPLLAMLSLQAALMILTVVGAALALCILLVGLFDFCCHRSTLYVAAFQKRYRVRPPTLTGFTLADRIFSQTLSPIDSTSGDKTGSETGRGN